MVNLFIFLGARDIELVQTYANLKGTV